MKCTKWPGCPNEAAPGKKSCQRCLDRHKASRDKMIAVALKEGYCKRCRKVKAPAGKLCDPCLGYAKAMYLKRKMKKYREGS